MGRSLVIWLSVVAALGCGAGDGAAVDAPTAVDQGLAVDAPRCDGLDVATCRATAGRAADFCADRACGRCAPIPA